MKSLSKFAEIKVQAQKAVKENSNLPAPEFKNWYGEIENETEKAIKIEGVWIPKSVCGSFIGKEKITGIEVKTWFHDKNYKQP